MAAFNLQVGFDKVDEIGAEIERRAALAKSGAGRTFRFWMKAGEEKKITFLTNEPPIIKEHNIKLAGKFGNTFTCLKQMGEACPVCDSGDRPSDVGFFAIIDHTPFVIQNGPNKGQKREWSVKVLPAKYKVLAQLKKFALKYKSSGGLTGKTFDASRTSAEAANTGDMLIPDSQYSVAELESLLGKPLAEVVPNWKEYLAPKTAAELTAILGGKAQEADAEAEETADLDFK